jgi:murein DD-endopeptidase MepM/ murein hydrolase activator NlpD
MHDGVDIAAPVGTPVHAAAAGRVIYAGRVRGYGNIVIVQHADHYATVYGHNSINEVRAGQSIARGQVISKVGTTGRTTGPNLHFEVRRYNVAHNPLAYLPPLDSSIGTRFAGGQ